MQPAEAPAAGPAGDRAVRRTRQRSPFRLSPAAETAMHDPPPGRAESKQKATNPSKPQSCVLPETPAESPSQYRTELRTVRRAVQPQKMR